MDILSGGTVGELEGERLEALRLADKIILEDIQAADLYTNHWQSFAALLPIKTVGVMGGSRT